MTPVGRCTMHACMQLEAANAAQRYGPMVGVGRISQATFSRTKRAGPMACSRGQGLSRNTNN